jgi:type IV pilus assembly protein PilM
MKSTTFGLDIGSGTLKAVWLDGADDKLSLLSCVVVPTPLHGLASESMLDHEEMAQAIRQMLDEGKISVKSAHIALAENQVFTKVIEMPVLSEKELASAIKWEAEQYVPAALSTMTLDHLVLKNIQTDNGEKMLVLLVAAPTSLISRYQKVLEMAGLQVASVETDILSVVRSSTPNNAKDTIFLVHIGSLTTSFAIMQQGIIIFTYSIPVGGLAVDRAIASDFGFSISQAEEYKKTYGISDQNLSGKIGKAIGPIISTIVLETKKAIAFYKERYHAQYPIHQLLLSGSTASLPGLTAYFANQCGIETVVADPFEQKHIEQVPEEIAVNASEFAIAVGLAMKEYE